MQKIINITKNELREEYKTAMETHQRIMANAEICASSLLEMCKDLKKMRDEKLYNEFGYSTFDEYTEKMVGVKARQAYTYISTYEKLGSTVLQSNAGLGITKLALISEMNPIERTEVLDGGELNGMSVAEIKELVKKSKEQGEQISLLQAENKELKNKAEGADEYDTENHEYIFQLEEEIRDLKKKISEAAVENSSETEEEILKLKTEIKKLNSSFEAEINKKVNEKLLKKNEELEKKHKKELEAVKSSAKKEAEESAKSKIELLTAAVTVAEKNTAELQKKLELSDSASAQAQVYIKAIQENFNSLFAIINAMSTEAQGKYRGAAIKLLDLMRERCEK